MSQRNYQILRHHPLQHHIPPPHHLDANLNTFYDVPCFQEAQTPRGGGNSRRSMGLIGGADATGEMSVHNDWGSNKKKL